MPEETQRKLAAILSADVAGYSRLMADDEEATVRTVTAYREQFVALVREHRGRVVDATGDNVLADFATASDAVEAAIEIQRVIEARNAALAAERRMEFRIGVHLGEVRVEGERLYGDGVNLAARLEGLAEPGGICVSAAVRDQVARRLGLAFADLGEQAVKNLPEPVRVYRVSGDAEGRPREAPTRRSTARTATIAALVAAVVALLIAALVYRVRSTSRPVAPTVPSGAPLTAIAVLPFDDLSPGGDHAWLANGMAEELIEMLSRTEALQVVARTSAQVAKERGGDVAAIGELLNVGSVVEGSVRSAGDQLRVTVQLIRVADGYHLWSGRFERKLDDVFAIQEEIGREVAEALRSELGVVDQYTWEKDGRYVTGDVRAYEFVKRGMNLVLAGGAVSLAGDLVERNEEVTRSALDYYRRALDIDPNFAEAHAATGWGYYYLWLDGFDRRPEVRNAAVAEAERALELDPANGGAHNLLANVSMDEGDWKSAKDRYELALEASPGHDFLLRGYGRLLLAIGLVDQALVQTRLAIDLQPLHGGAHFEMGEVHLALRDYEAAIASYQRAVELGSAGALANLPFAYCLGGRDGEALEAWIRWWASRFAGDDVEARLRAANAEGGIVRAAEATLAALVSHSGRSCWHSPLYAARMLALIGDRDRMFACLDESISEHRVERLAKVHPIYDPYRADPRFQAFLERLRLTE